MHFARLAHSPLSVCPSACMDLTKNETRYKGYLLGKPFLSSDNTCSRNNANFMTDNIAYRIIKKGRWAHFNVKLHFSDIVGGLVLPGASELKEGALLVPPR